MDKEQLRKEMREKREALTEDVVEAASRKVYERLIGMPQLKDAKTVLVYADFDHEIHTGELTGWLLYNGKTVGLPLIEDDEMSAMQYRGNQIRIGRFGIAEPVGGAGTEIPADRIDLIICPGVAFTEKKDRVGFGRGYFDRFFQRAANAYKIGLAYDFQIADDVKTGPNDVKMDAIVTPDRIIA